MKKAYRLLCIFLIVLFAFLGCQNSRHKDYCQLTAYTDGYNKYGNAPYATNLKYRLVAESGDGIVICKDGSFERDVNGELIPSNIYIIDKDNTSHFVTTALTGQISCYDGWIYFSDWNYGNNSYYYCTKLNRIKSDGSEEETVYSWNDIESDRFNSFCIANGKIFLNGIYGSVKSMDLDGKNLKEIQDDYHSLYNIQIFEDRVYYHYANKLSVSDIDGQNFKTILTDKEGISAYVDKDIIYCYSYNSKELYMMSTDGTNKKTLIKNLDTVYNLFSFDGYLFYQYQKSDKEKDINCMEKINISTGERTLICDDILRGKYSVLSATLADGWIYYNRVAMSGENDSMFSKIDIYGNNKIDI